MWPILNPAPVLHFNTHLSSQVWVAPLDQAEYWHKNCLLLLGQTSLLQKEEIHKHTHTHTHLFTTQ